MNIIQVEDKKKYTKSSGINSVEFFISWDSIYFLYIISYISLTYYILYMFTFNMYILMTMSSGKFRIFSDTKERVAGI